MLQLEAQLMDRNVSIELTRAEAAAWLADKGYDDKMGARPLARVIQEAHQEAACRGVALWQARQRRQRQGWRQGRQAGPSHRRARQTADRFEEETAAPHGGLRLTSRKTGAPIRRARFISNAQLHKNNGRETRPSIACWLFQRFRMKASPPNPAKSRKPAAGTGTGAGGGGGGGGVLPALQ